MPKKLEWKFLHEKKFNNRLNFKQFYECQLATLVDKNNKTNCTLCSSNKDAHKMENILMICNSNS